MRPSLLVRYIEKFTGGILRTAGEKWIDAIAIACAALYQWIFGGRPSFWENVTPVVWMMCLILIVHVVMAVAAVWREVIKAPKGHVVESPIFLPNNERRTEFVHEPAPRLFRLKLLVIGVSSLILLSLPPYFVQHMKVGSGDLAGTDTARAQPNVEQPTHTLLVDYGRDMLPIRIAPHDTAYILQLNPNITEGLWLELNDGKKAITWPKDLHPKKDGPSGDSIYVCNFTNDEDKTFLDISIPFEVRFYELQEVPATAEREKDGRIKALTIPVAPDNHVTFGRGGPGGAVGVRAGALVKQFTHSESLPSIAPGSTARIYLVNQSKFISGVEFPTKGTAIIAGNARAVRISLVRPAVTVVDRLPLFELAPSSYHWNGVPDSP